MNIFPLDNNLFKSAEYLVDTHTVKLALENFQMLSTAHRVLDGTESFIKVQAKGSWPIRYRNNKVWKLFDERENILYKATHINHPCSVWVRESLENYNWLVEYTNAILNEYTYRYGKIHKCERELMEFIKIPPNNIKNSKLTELPLCMPDEYKISNNVIESYREYYRKGKVHLHKWSKRDIPNWI